PQRRGDLVATAFLFAQDILMMLYSTTIRVALSAAIAVSSFVITPAYALADDEARRAILDLREQVHQMAEQDRRVRLDFADQIETLKHEVMSLRGTIEQLKWA